MTQNLERIGRNKELESLVLVEIGFVYDQSDEEEKLLGIQQAKALIARHQGKIIREQISTNKKTKVTTVRLIVEVTRAVRNLHHDFDSILNNADTGCGAGWVTDYQD